MHTKRVPLWIPFDPARDDAAALAARIRERAAAYPRRLPRVRRPPRRRGHRAGRPRRARRADPARRPRRRRARRQERAAVARPLPPRDRGDGRRARARRLHSLDEGESFAIEYWPLELYKLSLRRRPASCRAASRSSPARPAASARAIVDALASAGACVVAFDLDGDGAADAVEALGDGGVAVGGDVTAGGGGGGGVHRAVEAFGGRRHRRLQRRAWRRARRSSETTLAEWRPQPRDPRDAATSSSRARLSDPARAGARRLGGLRRLQERARGRQERGGLLVGQGGRAAPRPLPGRGGRRAGSASTRSTPTPSCRARGSGARTGARSAPRPTGSSPTSSRSTTASARRSA